MADSFRCDPQVARELSQDLAGIRAEMQSLKTVFEGFDGAVASPRVERALKKFFDDSSDYREATQKRLERASGLLRGLAEGATTLDRELASSFDQAHAQARNQPAVAPGAGAPAGQPSGPARAGA